VPADRDGERLVSSVLWERRDRPALEHFRLWEHPDGPRLHGTVVGVLGHLPASVSYEVACAPDWSTRRAVVTAVLVDVAHRVELVADDAGRWWVNGRERPELFGCVDVDVSVTPSTNTLPIRRLALAEGDGCDVTAAWVRVDQGVHVEPLSQRYTRVAEDRYRYESRGGEFVTHVTVDDDGVVVRYPPAWERVHLPSPRDR
jgi:uncharacterized protein